MTTKLNNWLALTPEDPIDPDLPICDPHHHLWDGERGRYLLDQLLEDTNSGHNITETVFIECSAMYRASGPDHLKPVGETEFVQGVAAMSASRIYGDTKVAAGIVGYANLTLGSAVRETLEAHLTASPDKFKGIRHAACWDADPEIGGYKKPPPNLLSDPKFREGYAVLNDMKLSFEGWLYHHQLPELTDLARAFPNTTIIVNHIAGPIGIHSYAGRDEEVLQTWKNGMAELATCPNVVIKLGGLGMPLGGRDWHQREKPPGSTEIAETIAPYYLYAIDQFGPDRCMFESNFPVDKVSMSYNVLWNAFKRLAADFTPTEKASLFRETARTAYRLT